MLSIIYAVIGQLLDARSTQVSLSSGRKELNPLVAWVIRYAGIPGLYILKFIPPLLFALAGYFYLNIFIGTVGLGAAIYNYRGLWKSGIKKF